MIATTLSFTERYDEMHAIGLPDWQIAQRMEVTLSSLERMLERYDRPVSDLLRDMAREERNPDV
ncbi:hypothetical protein [Mycobacterium sp. DL440]|uniref:hypothetical protein n=1 Tax=Mycobacterium sp. DL440 TaxID=2675523 RepID=UPI0014229C92|nr:hypothetical protein [Mycobacterium sp. DL440]